MSMKKRPGVVIRTRLLSSEVQQFRKLCTERGVTRAALAHDALLFYIAYHRNKNNLQLDSQHSQQLKAATNRTCALLAKIAADVRALYYFLGEEDRDTLTRCRQAAVQTICQSLSPEEAQTAAAMNNFVPPRSNNATNQVTNDNNGSQTQLHTDG